MTLKMTESFRPEADTLVLGLVGTDGIDRRSAGRRHDHQSRVAPATGLLAEWRYRSLPLMPKLEPGFGSRSEGPRRGHSRETAGDKNLVVDRFLLDTPDSWEWNVGSTDRDGPGCGHQLSSIVWRIQ